MIDELRPVRRRRNIFSAGLEARLDGGQDACRYFGARRQSATATARQEKFTGRRAPVNGSQYKN